MKKLSWAVSAALLCASTGVLASDVEEVFPEQPQISADSADAVDETASNWFVELSGAPTADGGNAGALRSEKNSFRNAARQAGVRYTERFAYDSLFNGLSVQANPVEINKIARLAGVTAIYPVESFSLPPITSDAPDMATAIAMTGADVARNELGLDGTGVKVAIMDTGIDIDHADFGGNGVPGANSSPFPNAKIVAGYDFVGNAYTGSSGSAPVPGGRPDDCHGHGTHVAGIVAANGAVKGVAPKAQLGAYRVFGCSGTTEADIMIAAMERALADGMQVLNMSIGSSFQWPDYPTAKAADRMVNKGMVVVASIGNSGTSGIYAAGAPGVGKKVIGVASYDNTHTRLATFSISPDNMVMGYGAATGAPTPPTSGTSPMKRTGTATSTADACSALPAGSLSGSVALIRRGTCGFHDKARNAQAAGAIGVVLYNNSAGRFSPSVVGAVPIVIPVVAVSDLEGVTINNRLASGAVSMTWSADFASFPNPAGGLISSFSSYGTTYDLSLKPDIGGPGGAIYSTYPLEFGGFATLGGTSMSSPHVAGTAALLIQAAPNTSSQSVRTTLQNSAVPRVWSGNPGLGFLDMTHRQGAGMVRIDRAVLATTRVEPGKLSLGESEFGAGTRTLTISNNSGTAVTYTPSFVNALSTGANSYTPTFFSSTATAQFSSSSLLVAANGSATLDVTITPPATPVGGLYGGYLVLTPNDGGQDVRVPFSGYIGDYQARQVLTPTPNGFPWLARFNGSSYFKRADGDTYSMADALNAPFFLFHFDHGARRLRGEVFDAVTGKAWHRAFDEQHVARNSTATGFFAYAWDGVTTAGKKSYTVPNGQYVIRFSVQKALGDDNNPAHWETWTSPVITIQR